MSAQAPRVLVLHWGRFGGGPKFAFEMAKALEEIAPNRIYSSYSKSCDLVAEFEGLTRVRALPVRTFSSKATAVLLLPILIQNLWLLFWFVKTHKIDVVVVAMEQIWQWPLRAALRPLNVPLLLSIHDAQMHPGDSSKAETLLRRLERGNASGFLTFSSFVTGLVEQGRQDTKPMYETIHPAYGFERKRVARRRGVSTDNRLVVGFFGRISAYKGLKMGIDAVRIASQSTPGIELKIMGSGDVGDLDLSGLNVQVVNRWIKNEEIVPLLDQLDLLILPYVEASQSGVLAYAIGLGLPVVVTPVGALPEQVRLAGVGVVAESVSPEAVANGICLLAQDDQFYTGCSVSALRSSQLEFSSGRMAHDIYSFCIKIVEESRKFK